MQSPVLNVQSWIWQEEWAVSGRDGRGWWRLTRTMTCLRGESAPPPPSSGHLCPHSHHHPSLIECDIICVRSSLARQIYLYSCIMPMSSNQFYCASESGYSILLMKSVSVCPGNSNDLTRHACCKKCQILVYNVHKLSQKLYLQPRSRLLPNCRISLDLIH